MWNRGSRLAYSPMRTKLGELIVSLTPRPAPKPFANTVFPAPSSPHRHTTSPGSAAVARPAAIERVASGLVLRRSRAGTLAVVTRPSGKALEVADRDRDGRAAAQADERRLQGDTRPEEGRPGEAR